jgi:hypothetical protein
MPRSRRALSGMLGWTGVIQTAWKYEPGTAKAE